MNSSMWVKAAPFEATKTIRASEWFPQGDKATAEEWREVLAERVVQDSTQMIYRILQKQGIPQAKINRKMRRIEALIREVLEK